MEKIAIFVDDVDHARHLLTPMLAKGAGDVSWTVVACAPRLTHRIGKWVSHSNREQWRAHWARAQRSELEPLFAGARGPREWLVARGPLDQLSTRLRGRLGADLRILDLRRPKLGVTLAPVSSEQAPASASRWAAPVAVSSSLAVVLALTD